MNYNLQGIKLLALQIISLISNGEKETIDDIRHHSLNGDIIEYLNDKYFDKMNLNFVGNSSYDIKAWNDNFLDHYSSWVDGNESRKLGITNKDSGLLVLLGIILEDLKESK